MNVGSLCTGYGGLDLAVEHHYSARPVWFSELEAHAANVAATRLAVPNLGDLTAVDWTQVEPVDVLTAGYPCQPFSHAGRRKGTTDDRHIWPHIAAAVRVLRPRRVVLENVAWHLSLGFGDVLGDLAALGYDVRWGCVRAADAGAPHRRERVFIVATDADGDGQRRGQEQHREPSPRLDRPHRGHVDGRRVETTRGTGMGEHQPAADTEGIGGDGERGHGHDRSASRREGLQGPTRGSDRSTPDADGMARPPGRPQSGRPGAVDGPGTVERAKRLHSVDWGAYAAAVHRWEHIVGRAAPAPVDDAGRLAPRFVEWMMGLPDGWVTELTPKRTHALRILGNGVVPQQAALALALLDPQEVAP